jgi:putative salt-induced outer membrane protein YdiY
MHQLTKISFVCLVSLSLLAKNSVFAECNPATDPCAPKKVQGAWDAGLSFGFNLTRGNSETALFNVGARADKDDGSDIYNLNASYNYGEDDNAVGPKGDSTTRNDFRGGGRWDHLLDDRVYAGLGSSFLYDEIADIDYRLSLDPGIGYYFLKDNTFKLRSEVGPSYVFERQGSENNDYLAPRIGEKFEWVLTCTSKFFQSAEVLFDISDSDNYIVNAEVGVEAALSSTLALVFTVREAYDNLPAIGREKSDLQVITALKVSL